jgi:hypothetical protein
MQFTDPTAHRRARVLKEFLYEGRATVPGEIITLTVFDFACLLHRNTVEEAPADGAADQPNESTSTQPENTISKTTRRKKGSKP